MLNPTDQVRADATTAAVRAVFGHIAPVEDGVNVVVPLTRGRSRTLRAGIRNDEAFDAFTNGQCFALAFAINLRTGWPIVWIGDAQCAYDEECSEWPDGPWCGCQLNHAAVLAPDGRLLDIFGPGTLFQKVTDLGWMPYPLDIADYTWGVLDLDALDAVLDGRYWKSQRVEAALPLVDIMTATLFTADRTHLTVGA